MKRSLSAGSAGILPLLLLFLLGAGAPRSVAQANLVGQWSTLPYTMPINPVHAALLHTGKVLIVSGSGNVAGNTNYQAAIWDPQAGTITTQALAWDMFCNSMIVLPDGRPFVSGGTLQYDPFHGYAKTSAFDPVANTFTDQQSTAHGRWYPTTTVLGDGRVMIFSGLDENGVTNQAVELYTVGTGWSQEYQANWTPPLYPRMHLLPSGKVIYTGSTHLTEIFDPATEQWTWLTNTEYGGVRSYGTSVLLPLSPANNYDARVMILGGGNPASNTTEILDTGAAAPAWQWGPNMSQARTEMNAVILPSGKVLAVGGSAADEDVTTASLNADLYDPAANIFSAAGANTFAHLYHSIALLLPDATVMLTGGNPTRGSFEPHMEIYQPAYLFTTDGSGNAVPAARPVISAAPANLGYGSTFVVQTTDARNIAAVVMMRDGAVTHAFDMDQRMVSLSFSQGAGGLTVTAPPNGNIAPPGYYMLSLVNNAGVPSVASFVQIGAQTDFAVAVTPSRRSVSRGSRVRFAVASTGNNGFSGTIKWSISTLPTHAAATFAPATVTGTSQSTLLMSISPQAAPGNYTLTITGASGSLSHTTVLSLAIR